MKITKQAQWVASQRGINGDLGQFVKGENELKIIFTQQLDLINERKHLDRQINEKENEPDERAQKEIDDAMKVG